MTNHHLGVLVVGHGTRDTIGQAQMRNLACQMAGQLAPIPTDLGFLELAEPSIAAGIDRLAAVGVRELVVVPVLLFRAGHADHDIPDAVKEAADRHEMRVRLQTDPLELQPSVLALSAERFRQALSECPLAENDRIHLAMIARGSSSETAAEKMRQFTLSRIELTPVATHTIGYVAVRKPNVQETLELLSQSDADVLVVQPHLLFEGEVYRSIGEAVKERQRADGRRWFVTQVLGPPVDDFHDERLAIVLAQMTKDAMGQLGLSASGTH